MDFGKHILVFVIVIVCTELTGGFADCDYPEHRLHRYLLNDYEKSARPAPTAADTTDVSIDLSLISIENYDSKRRVLTAMTWVSIGWEDPRLAWHNYSGMFGGIESLHVLPSNIWVPDIVLFNSLEPFPPQFPPRLQVIVSDTGKALLITPSVLKSRCAPTNVTNVVTCTYKFMSWTYHGQDIKLSLGYGGLSLHEYSPTPGLTIIGTSANVSASFYACCPEPYYDVKFSIDIELSKIK